MYPQNVPNVVPQVSTYNGPLGTSKLQSSEGKGIDFVKQKKYKPFRSGYSKYAEHRVCWLYGNVGHLHTVCPKRMHVRGDVPFNVYPSMQKNTGMTFILGVHNKVAPNRPMKMI